MRKPSYRVGFALTEADQNHLNRAAVYHKTDFAWTDNLLSIFHDECVELKPIITVTCECCGDTLAVAYDEQGRAKVEDFECDCTRDRYADWVDTQIDEIKERRAS